MADRDPYKHFQEAKTAGSDGLTKATETANAVGRGLGAAVGIAKDDIEGNYSSAMGKAQDNAAAGYEYAQSKARQAQDHTQPAYTDAKHRGQSTYDPAESTYNDVKHTAGERKNHLEEEARSKRGGEGEGWFQRGFLLTAYDKAAESISSVAGQGNRVADDRGQKAVDRSSQRADYAVDHTLGYGDPARDQGQEALNHIGGYVDHAKDQSQQSLDQASHRSQEAVGQSKGYADQAKRKGQQVFDQTSDHASYIADSAKQKGRDTYEETKYGARQAVDQTKEKSGEAAQQGKGLLQSVTDFVTGNSELTQRKYDETKYRGDQAAQSLRDKSQEATHIGSEAAGQSRYEARHETRETVDRVKQGSRETVDQVKDRSQEYTDKAKQYGQETAEEARNKSNQGKGFIQSVADSVTSFVRGDTDEDEDIRERTRSTFDEARHKSGEATDGFKHYRDDETKQKSLEVADRTRGKAGEEKGFIESMAESVSSFVGGESEDLKHKGRSTYNATKDTTYDISDRTRGKSQEAYDKVKGKGHEVYHATKGQGQELGEQGKGYVKSITDTVKALVKGEQGQDVPDVTDSTLHDTRTKNAVPDVRATARGIEVKGEKAQEGKGFLQSMIDSATGRADENFDQMKYRNQLQSNIQHSQSMKDKVRETTEEAHRAAVRAEEVTKEKLTTAKNKSQAALEDLKTRINVTDHDQELRERGKLKPEDIFGKSRQDPSIPDEKINELRERGKLKIEDWTGRRQEPTIPEEKLDELRQKRTLTAQDWTGSRNTIENRAQEVQTRLNQAGHQLEQEEQQRSFIQSARDAVLTRIEQAAGAGEDLMHRTKDQAARQRSDRE